MAPPDSTNEFLGKLITPTDRDFPDTGSEWRDEKRLNSPANPELLKAFSREVDALRRNLKGFKDEYQHPELDLVGSGLELSPNRDLNNFLQAVAFQAARVHWRLDQELAQVPIRVLEHLLPEAVTRVPAVAICRFAPDVKALDQEERRNGVVLPRGLPIYLGGPASAAAEPYSLCYDTRIWPLAVRDDEARFESGGTRGPTRVTFTLRLSENAVDETLSSLDVDTLRFFVDVENPAGAWLYESLTAPGNVPGIHAESDTGASADVSTSQVRPVGFAPSETVLQHASARSHPGLLLLIEYLAARQKFGFIDLTGLLNQWRTLDARREIQLAFESRLPAPSIDRAAVSLGCAPVVNLRRMSTDVAVRRTEFTHPIYVNVPSGEVLRVETATFSPKEREGVTLPLQPVFMSGLSQGTAPAGCWAVRHDPSSPQQPANPALSLASFRPDVPLLEGVVTAQVWVTTTQLQSSTTEADPQRPGLKGVVIVRPKVPPPPDLSADRLWALTRLLVRGYEVFVQPSADASPAARPALVQLLDLLNPLPPADGTPPQPRLKGVRSETVVRYGRLVSADAGPTRLHLVPPPEIFRGIDEGFIRGSSATFDIEDPMPGTSAFLLGRVLSESLALYLPTNSVCDVAVILDSDDRDKQRRREYTWNLCPDRSAAP